MPATKRASIWDNWIILALLANVSFSTANLLIGSLSSELGIKSSFYFCSGSLTLSILYFIYQKEWNKRNNPEQQSDPDAKKVLTRTWENRFDWYSVLIVLGGSIFQLSIFLSTSYSFKLCSEANLNIGVSQAIWAINPFLIALLDWLIYGMQLKVHHILGMSVMILCFVSISLSKLSEESNETISTDEAAS